MVSNEAVEWDALIQDPRFGRRQHRAAVRTQRVRGGLGHRAVLRAAGRARVRPAGGADCRGICARELKASSVKSMPKPGSWAALLAAMLLPCAPAFAQAGVVQSYRW